MSETEPILGGMVICRPEPINFQAGHILGFRLMSDLHIGASHVDYKLIQQELTDAIEWNDRILINGDLWDMILTKDHKRFDPDVIHPRLRGRKDIVNPAIEWAKELLTPAAHLIDMIGIGNHEATVARFHSFDPTAVLIHDLTNGLTDEQKKTHVIHYGGYTGFVDYRFRRNSNSSPRQESGRRWVLYYHHGAGGAAPVTRGMIDFNRKDTFVQADCLWMGHKHQRLTVAVEKLSCPMTGWDVNVSDVRHVMTGGYFKTYVGQTQSSIRKYGRRSNYAADAGLGPGGKGGARVVLTFDRYRDYHVRIEQ